MKSRLGAFIYLIDIINAAFTFKQKRCPDSVLACVVIKITQSVCVYT